MQTPTFEGPQATSFSSAYASSLCNSHVLVKRRHFETFARHVIESRGRSTSELARTAPFALVVSPDGHHGVLSSHGTNDVFDEQGKGWSGREGDAIAFDDRVYLYGVPGDWAGKGVVEEPGFTSPAVARRIDAKRYAVVATSEVAPHDQPIRPLFGVQGGPRVRGDSTAAWFAGSEGRGIGAIGADFTAVLASDAGLLQVVPPIADKEGRAQPVGERNVGVAARWLSLIGPHIMLIVADGAGSKLQVFTGDTTPVYSLTVPFEVLQPAIAGAGMRVYLAGKGLAALDDGKVTWTHASAEPIYASSFEDGSLAIATGKRLDLVRTDGTVDQSFNTEEPLVAPPAIAGDGSVWVASATALYVAR